MSDLKTQVPVFQQANLKQIAVGRIGYGQDIHQSLAAFCKAQGIHTAWVNMLGALSQAELAFYHQEEKKYYTRVFEGHYEIISATGNMTLKDGEPFGHIHLCLSDDQFGCVAGHLMPNNTKVFACEFALWVPEAESTLTRNVVDEQTGLAIWPSGLGHCQI